MATPRKPARRKAASVDSSSIDPSSLNPDPAVALMAASDVVARRMEILGAALTNPGQADVTEIMLMGAEKVEAFSAAAAALTRDAGKLSADLGQAAGEETALAARALGALGASTTPAAMAAIQSDYWLGAWSRAAGHALAFNSAIAASQAAAWAPISAAAVANAKRLKR